MQQVAPWEHVSTRLVNSVASRLRDSAFGGVSCDPGEGNTSSLQLQKEQDVVRGEATPGQDLDRKEIRACKNCPIRSDEVLPADADPSNDSSGPPTAVVFICRTTVAEPSSSH